MHHVGPINQYTILIEGNGKLNAEDGAHLRAEHDLEAKGPLAMDFGFDFGDNVTGFEAGFFKAFLEATAERFAARPHEGCDTRLVVAGKLYAWPGNSDRTRALAKEFQQGVKELAGVIASRPRVATGDMTRDYAAG